MKKLIILFLFLIASPFVMATPLTTAQFENNIERTIVAMQRESQTNLPQNASRVEITTQFHLNKPIMFWVSKNTSKTCRGVLIEGNQIAVPSSCFKKSGYQLDSFYYTLSNGMQFMGNLNDLVIKKDLIFLAPNVNDEMLKTLVHIDVDYSIDRGEIYQSFQDFLDEHKVCQVHFRSRKGGGRIVPDPRSCPDSTLQVGDALMHEGRVVALVKRKINCYEIGLPFDILAFFTK